MTPEETSTPEPEEQPQANPDSEAPSPEHPRSETRELEDRLREELSPHLEVLRLLGRGSAASVYLAREPSLRRLVALKVLSPELGSDRKARLRFEREAQSAARISHPNVVAVYRVGALSDDLPYLVMQYVRGRNLAERVEAEGPLQSLEVRRILADLASGLADAHRRRIVHRDVKPANVLYEEETGRVFLTDFGLAAALDPEDREATRLTTRGHVLGDPRYRSPEQLRGEEITELADVYGLGLLGYELLTGEGPYEASSRSQLLIAHLQGDPRPLRSLRPDVDADLEALIARCLRKVPAQRPRADELVRELTGGAAATARQGTAHPSGPGSRGPPAESAAPAAEPSREPSVSSAEPSTSDAAGAGVAEEPLEAPAEARPTVRPPSDVIRFRTLGGLDLNAPDGRRLLSVIAQPKRVALLAYLAIGSSRGFKRRDSLLGVFWPEVEQERARHSLRQALYVLRRGLGADVILSRGDEEVGIREDQLWCDAVAFERAVDSGGAAKALEWYQGDLLPGFFISDAPEFERWLDAERQRLRRLASDAAWSLADRHEEAESPREAATWARRAVELSPWDESSLCRLIELLDRTGDRAGAIRAYEAFADRLRDEFEAEPAPETQALIQRVRER